MAYNICQERELARDVVQDGFMGILGSDLVFTDVSHAQRYLTGCVKNAAFMRLNYESRIRAMRHDFVHCNNDHNPIADKIRHFVNRLKCPMVRAIIHELYFSGKTRTEVAQQYEIDRHTVAAKEKKGLEQLYNILINR